MSCCTGCGRTFAEDDRFCAQCGKPRAAPVASSDSPGSGDASTSAGASPAGGSSVGRLVLLIAGFAAVPLLLFAVTDCNGSTEGHLAVAAGPRPGFTFTPTGCSSMQPYGRFGANLHAEGPNDGGLYVTRDPTRGTAVEIEIPGSCQNPDGTECTVFPVPRDQCRTFEVHVEFTGTTVNDVRQVEGHVSLDCTLTDGTTVRGRVAFDGC